MEEQRAVVVKEAAYEAGAGAGAVVLEAEAQVVVAVVVMEVETRVAWTGMVGDWRAADAWASAD